MILSLGLSVAETVYLMLVAAQLRATPWCSETQGQGLGATDPYAVYWFDELGNPHTGMQPLPDYQRSDPLIDLVALWNQMSEGVGVRWTDTVNWGADVQQRREATGFWASLRDAFTLTQLLEMTSALGAVWLTGARYYDQGPLCGVEMECFTEGFFPYGTVTTGHTVVTKNEELTTRLQVHEYTHLLDLEDAGSIIFYPAYGIHALLGMESWGNDEVPWNLHAASLFEQRAFDAEDQWSGDGTFPNQGFVSEFWATVSP